MRSSCVYQPTLFPEEKLESPINQRKIKLLNLDEYDKIVISYSGGKDSLACLLYMLEMGIPREKMELHHQSVDGAPGSPYFMDWECTEQYIISTGVALGIPVRFMWREGGFLGELLRENSRTKDVQYLQDGKIITLPTTKGSFSTRRKFPAKSADLSRRWCSANLKIDVASRFLSNHPDFKGNPFAPIKILYVTGERREESAARSRYLEMEEHRCNTKSRIIHHWRVAIDYPEERVWELIEKHKITPHPAYLLGFGRTSCFGCIFSTPDYYCWMRELSPDRFNQLVEMENELGFTIDNKYNLIQMADMGSLKRMPREVLNSSFIQKALSGVFRVEDFFSEKWELPAGAFRGAAGGPT